MIIELKHIYSYTCVRYLEQLLQNRPTEHTLDYVRNVSENIIARLVEEAQ